MIDIDLLKVVVNRMWIRNSGCLYFNKWNGIGMKENREINNNNKSNKNLFYIGGLYLLYFLDGCNL